MNVREQGELRAKIATEGPLRYTRADMVEAMARAFHDGVALGVAFESGLVECTDWVGDVRYRRAPADFKNCNARVLADEHLGLTDTTKVGHLGNGAQITCTLSLDGEDEEKVFEWMSYSGVSFPDDED